MWLSSIGTWWQMPNKQRCQCRPTCWQLQFTTSHRYLDRTMSRFGPQRCQYHLHWYRGFSFFIYALSIVQIDLLQFIFKLHYFARLILRQDLETLVQHTGPGKISYAIHKIWYCWPSEYMHILLQQIRHLVVTTYSRVLQFFGETFGIEYVLPKMVNWINLMQKMSLRWDG